MTFPAGMTEVSFNITIIDDTTLEYNETFFLTILQSSLPSDVATGLPFQATMIIVDDDGK